MKYSKHSLNQKSKITLVTNWAFKEGVFQTPKGDYIARIKIKNKNRYETISRHKTKEEAESAFNLRKWADVLGVEKK